MSDAAGETGLTGTDGNDNLQVSGIGVSVEGGAGQDLIWIAQGTTGIIDAGADDDSVYLGEWEGLFLDGGAGSDRLLLGPGVYDLSSVTNFETIVARTTLGTHTHIVVSDATIPVGGVLTVQSFPAVFDLPSGPLTIDGSAVIASRLNLVGSAELMPWSNELVKSADFFIGGAQADTLVGHGGDDTLQGGGGDDLLGGGTGIDTAVYQGNRADYVLTRGNGILIVSGPDGTDTLIGINQLQFADGIVAVEVPGITLLGPAEASSLEGTEGDDTLIGGAGDDWLHGSDGQDLLTGGTGHDMLNGEAGADTLSGEDGKDTMSGGSGSDNLNGGLGNDALSGGEGIDVFLFTTKLGTWKTDRNVNFDTIFDFCVKDDSIWLDNAVFKKLGSGTLTNPKLLKKSFFAFDKAKDSNDYIIYNRKTGVLSYDADGSGKGKAVEFAQLGKGLALKYTDIYII